MEQRHYPTVWISDIHLGYKDCKADFLLSFLDNCYIDTLYLVGDIVDMWALNKRMHWPKAHQKVLDKLIYLSEHGTRVIYIPGNHDAPLRNYTGFHFGNIQLLESAIHYGRNGKQYLIVHGDQFDADVLCYGKWFALVGDKAYDFLLDKPNQQRDKKTIRFTLLVVGRLFKTSSRECSCCNCTIQKRVCRGETSKS